MHSLPPSSPCSAWLCSSFLLFHSATTMWLHHDSLPFHGYAWCMPLTHAATYLVYVGTHQLDPIHTCTGSIKGRKCQPENSSLVLLVFPHNSQLEHLLNWLLAPSVSPSFDFNSLEPIWHCCLLGCFSTWVIKFWKPVITATSNKEEWDYFIQWTKANNIIVGLIKLCLSEFLHGASLS